LSLGEILKRKEKKVVEEARGVIEIQIFVRKKKEKFEFCSWIFF